MRVLKTPQSCKPLNFFAIMGTDNFTTHAFYCVSTFGGYEIELSADCSAARVRSNFDGKISPRPRFQEIKFTLSGDPFVTFYGRRLKLDNFLRV